MAEEDAVAVSLQAPLDNPHKRKLEDLEEETPTALGAEAPESTLEVDGDRKDKDKEDDDNEEDEETSELSKRPRLHEIADGVLASENGHKPDKDNDHAAENADTVAAVAEAETTVNNQVGGDENTSGLLQEVNGVQLVSENEQKVDTQDGNSEGKDAQMPSDENYQLENADKPCGNEVHEPTSEVVEQGDPAVSGQHHPGAGTRTMSQRIEIPNNKVGVLIGKAGETIKYLQINSGAKIQITRDADANPNSATRPVELVGTLESLKKAEKLIKDVIAEADAGGSPSLVARGFTATMTAGSAEIEIHVPSDKVGLIIGRGGETIRNLQTRSGARIQLIPQNFPGDQSKDKKVKVTGDKKQVEMAKELINEVMNQLPGRSSQFSNNNSSQQAYRPRGPGGAPQWGPRGPPPAQPTPYDYNQRGPYPSQNQQYPPQSYGNYPPQGPPRGNFGSGWDHRPPLQGPTPHGGGGYDHYGQGGGHAPQSTHMPGHHTPGGSMPPPAHSQPNYNYAQPPAQNYGHGYGDPKYGSQGPVQPAYGGGQGYVTPQQGYAPPQQQQQYNRVPPPYGMPSQGAPPPQGYAPPTATQPPNAPYQAPISAPQPYGQSAAPPTQPYQAPYGSAPVTHDGYTQPQPGAGFQHQGVHSAPQYGPQAASGYPQAAPPTGGYGQYPSVAQPGYTDQSSAGVTSGATYGYQGQVDQSGYATGQAYSGAPPVVGQQGYAQPVPAQQPGYDQSAPQTGGYATAPAGAPGVYGKTTVSPQPGYPQYDASQQLYGAPR